jgi:hypothetical protein
MAALAKRVLRVLRNALCFAAALAGFGALVNAWEPIPPIDQVSEKLELYGRSATNFDCLFFGSSKIHYGFIPSVFDEEMQRRGQKLTSFNFGVNAMGFPESGFLCRYVLDHFAKKPRYVFMEASSLRWYIPARHLHTRRVQYWHDPRSTWLAIRSLLADNPSLSALLNNVDTQSNLSVGRVLREHLLLFARRSTRVGEGGEWLQARLSPNALAKIPALDESTRGYTARQTVISGAALAEYEENLRTFDDTPAKPGEPFWDDAYLNLQRRVEAAGAKLILVVFPNHIQSRALFVHPPPGAPPVWSFDGPKRFPELYEPANRESNVHVNDKGAPIFTSLVAQRFDEWLKVQP